jgi:succinoglycan biosynthesis transport protein ExoP
MPVANVGGFGFAGLEYFGPREYLNIFRRSKWLILSLTLTVALLTAVMVHFIPNTYRATTVILVDPRKIPDSVVMSTVTSGVADRLATLRQQVMSSTRLGQIIDSMNLYPETRGKRSPEEIVERMRKDIDVEIMANGGDRGLGAFKISYSSRAPAQAAEVTNRLAAVFIEENVKAREQQVMGTAEFIDRELDEAKKELSQKEEVIRNIKTQYASALPESQVAHVQAINSMQIELRGEMDAVARAQQQKVYLQNSPSPAAKVDAAQPDAVVAELSQQESELQRLRGRYGPNHPDVLRQIKEVDLLRQRVAELSRVESARATASKGAAATVPMRSIEPQIAMLDQEIRNHGQRQDEIRSQIAAHQQKIDRMPVLEQQLASVMRDYETAREHYKLLLDRKFAADMSSNLETYQKAERFVVLDPAQPPHRPYRPNRLLMDIGGLCAGLALSLVLAVFLEINDSTVKTEAEVLSYIEAPVMGELPWVPAESERRRNRMRASVAFLTNTALALAYLGMVLFVK